jgi:dGTP triphosphohydrolase
MAGGRTLERSQKRRQINKFDDTAVVECARQISQAIKVSENAESLIGKGSTLVMLHIVRHFRVLQLLFVQEHSITGLLTQYLDGRPWNSVEVCILYA